MQVADITLKVNTVNQEFYMDKLRIEDVPTDIGDAIGSPSDLSATPYTPITGTKNWIIPVDVCVKNERGINGKISDIIKEAYDNNTSFTVDVWLYVEVDEVEENLFLND